jgi:ferritin-like metal-binding protein YciE
LGQAFRDHLVQTEQQVRRLDQIFKKRDESPGNRKCKGMAGLIEEARAAGTDPSMAAKAL